MHFIVVIVSCKDGDGNAIKVSHCCSLPEQLVVASFVDRSEEFDCDREM